MPITGACCCVCGGAVIDASGQPSWMAQFCAIYAIGQEVDTQVWLSGPGRREQLGDFVDTTSSSSANDDDETLRIDLMRSNPGRSLAVRTSPDRSQVWGFPFHSACWKILEISRLKESLDIQTLFKLCRSFPNQGSLLNWGHDYGGLAQFKNVLAPAEEPELEPSSALPAQTSDPFYIPKLGQVFTQQGVGSLAKQPDSSATTSVPQVSQVSEAGYFGRLPPELLSNILCYLPSSDVVCLKLASRVYTHLPLTDSFWKSRFSRGREFDYIFEADNHLSSHNGHWRSIFDSVKALKCQRAMLNRKRIWNLCLCLHEVLETARAGDCGGNPVKSFFEPNAASDEKSWVIASRCLKSADDLMFRGARSLHDRTLVIPSGEIVVFASLVNLFGRRYISGIRISDRSGESFSLGYINAENEALVSAVDQLVQISGICLALDDRGVRGLSLTSSTRAASNWVGDHLKIPKKMLLPVSSDSAFIDSLKGGFDAVKLVYLAAPSLREIESDTQLPPRFPDTALWYPKLPDPYLTFLGLSHNTYVSRMNKEWPICFNNFGGVGGENVRKLINITIQSRECGHVVSINFHYANAQATSRFGFPSADANVIHKFAIDGPGGERIVGLDTVRGWGQFLGFKMHTNRRRTGVFPSEFETDLPSDGGKITSIRAEGESVIGVWGVMTTRSGFLDIGLATSALGSK